MNRIPLTQSTGLVLTWSRLTATLVTALVVGIAGCASDGDEAAEPEAPPETGSEFSDAGATAEPPEREVVEEAPVAEVIEFSADPVYFAFDSSELDADTTGALRDIGGTLSDNGVSIVISGHCDARGSEEYNLALGERRAAAVRRYLGNLGVPMRQMTIVSYGEIRPAAQGMTDEAWALNRRAEFESSE